MPTTPETRDDAIQFMGTFPTAVPGAGRVWAFPPELGTPRFPHYVIFYINKNNRATPITEGSTTVDGGESKVNTMGGGIQSFTSNYTRTTDAIALYMPPKITTTYAQEYENTSMNFMGNALAGSVEGVKNSAGFVGGTIEALKASFVGIPEALLRREAGAFTNLGMSGSDAAIIGAATGKIDNPRTEAAFNSTKLRTHNFDFSFIPQSEHESKLVKDIIAIFKRAMHPEIMSSTVNNSEGHSLEGSYLITPNTFDIEFHNQDGTKNEMIHKITMSFLENMSVDYSGAGQWLAYKGTGNPFQINVSLQFQEMRPLHRALVSRGY